MSKLKLKCTCPICDEVHEVEADYLTPGIEGVINRPEGPIIILDSTKTVRHCKICSELLTKNAMECAEHLEVADE